MPRTQPDPTRHGPSLLCSSAAQTKCPYLLLLVVFAFSDLHGRTLVILAVWTQFSSIFRGLILFWLLGPCSEVTSPVRPLLRARAWDFLLWSVLPDPWSLRFLRLSFSLGCFLHLHVNGALKVGTSWFHLLCCIFSILGSECHQITPFLLIRVHLVTNMLQPDSE